MHTLALTLFLGLGFHLVQASFYQLHAFDTVHVGVLGSNQATVVIVPSPDETFSLNASQSGVAFSVTDGTLYLSQAVTVKTLLDGLLHDQDDDGVQTGAIYVEVGGLLAGVVSDTTNDVVVGDKFSSGGFTASLTTIGKLIVLGITTPFTSACNTGCVDSCSSLPCSSPDFRFSVAPPGNKSVAAPRFEMSPNDMVKNLLNLAKLKRVAPRKEQLCSRSRMPS